MVLCRLFMLMLGYACYFQRLNFQFDLVLKIKFAYSDVKVFLDLIQ
jgi:hypothetical protein